MLMVVMSMTKTTMPTTTMMMICAAATDTRQALPVAGHCAAQLVRGDVGGSGTPWRGQ